MKLSDQSGQDVGILEIIIVVRPIHVRGHGADEVAAVLAAVSLAHLDASDFRDGIPLVGGFERGGEGLAPVADFGRAVLR